MAIFTQSPFIQSVLLAGVISLAACGGGGGGTSKPPAPTPDTTPNAYSYSATTNAELSAVVTSAAVTISGIDTAAPVTITGGEYSIAGGAFTSAAGTVTNGQTITIRVTAPAVNSASASVQLTVGGVAATFTVTTKVDSIPNTFAFTAQTNAALNTEYTSDTITLTGIDTPVPISITGGTYSINGGAFTSAAGTVSVNNTIAVKGTSASARESTHNVVLTIGGVSATYSITTIADTTPPVAEFKFPTPYTMSEANTVKVRGTATDDNAITNVKVVVRSFKLDTPTETLATTEINATPKAETNGVKDFSSWTVDVPLTALAENEIKVIATDNRNNAIQLSDANKVVIRQADVKSAFPDEVNEFAGPTNSALIVVGGHSKTLVFEWRRVLAVDLRTGERTVLIDHQSECLTDLSGVITDDHNLRLYGICDPEKVLEFNLIDGSFISEIILNTGSVGLTNLQLDRFEGRNRLLVAERVSTGGRVISLALNSNEFSIASDRNETPPIIEAMGSIAIDEDSYWITTGGQDLDAAKHKVIRVDTRTGKREVFADNNTGSGELFNARLPNGETAFLRGVVKDTKNNRLIVMEDSANRLLTVDLDTRARALLRNISYVGANDTDVFAFDIDFDDQSQLLLITDRHRKAIVMVDVETGEKVILSKSKNSFQ